MGKFETSGHSIAKNIKMRLSVKQFHKLASESLLPNENLHCIIILSSHYLLSSELFQFVIYKGAM